MKKLKQLTNNELWYLGYHLAEMMQHIHMYFAGTLAERPRIPYNHINDGVKSQHHDLVSTYLKVKKILDPLFEENFKKEEKDKISKIKTVLDDLNDIIEGDQE